MSYKKIKPAKIRAQEDWGLDLVEEFQSYQVVGKGTLDLGYSTRVYGLPCISSKRQMRRNAEYQLFKKNEGCTRGLSLLEEAQYILEVWTLESYLDSNLEWNVWKKGKLRGKRGFLIKRLIKEAKNYSYNSKDWDPIWKRVEEDQHSILGEARLTWSLIPKAKRCLERASNQLEAETGNGEVMTRFNNLLELMKGSKLEEDLIVEFLVESTKLSVRDRGINSPFQPEYGLMWEIYGSYPEVEPWMRRVLYQAHLLVLFTGDRKFIHLDRPGNPVDLFDACKAWKTSCLFPKKIAIRVGRLPLWKRMVASEIIYQMMVEYCNLSIEQSWGRTYFRIEENWHTPEFYLEFWRRFSERAQQGKFACLADLHPSSRNKKRVIGEIIPENPYREILANNAKDFDVKNLIGIKTSALKEVLSYTLLQPFSHNDYTHLMAGLVGLVAIFGKNWAAYLDKCLSHQKETTPGWFKANPKEGFSENPNLFHDALYWILPQGTPNSLKGLDSFLMKWYKEESAELSVVVSAWSSLSEETKKLKSFKAVVAEARSLGFVGANSKEFAEEAGKWGMNKDSYKKYESIYIKSQQVETPFSTEISFKKGDYVGRFLPRKDVRVGFFGYYTNCCQHWTGIGAKSAISSVQDPFSQLFVVEKEGEILAGSWVWETHNQPMPLKEGQPDKYFSGVCFDNVEAKGLSQNQHVVTLEIYLEAANFLISTGKYTRVTLGTGLSDLELSTLPPTSPLSLPSHYSGYTDASHQKLLAESLEPSRLYERGQLASRAWVKGALEEDLELANQVAQQCYQDYWAQSVTLPSNPEHAYGLVLQTFDEGTVGYCTMDTEKKHVCDLAVLPKHRKHSNLLLREALNFMKSEGGTWTAEAKADTSLRLLQAYARRGKLKLEDRGVAHYVDGVACHNVAISFPES